MTALSPTGSRKFLVAAVNNGKGVFAQQNAGSRTRVGFRIFMWRCFRHRIVAQLRPVASCNPLIPGAVLDGCHVLPHMMSVRLDNGWRRAVGFGWNRPPPSIPHGPTGWLGPAIC